MGKVDRCAQFKKESQSARKRFVADQRQAAKEQAKADKEEAKVQEERLAQERAQARQAGSSKFQRAMQQGKANTTFASAAALVSEEVGSEGEDDDDAETEPAVPEYVSRNSESQPKKETAASRKKQQAERNKDDMTLLLEEERAARRQRIIWRLLRLLLVGFVIEAYREKPSQPAPKEGKPKKKGGKNSSESEAWSISSLREKANVFTGPVLMLIFTFFLGFLVIAGEDFDPEAVVSSEVNLYEVLGISSDADVLAVRKAYKNLALTWHPDKNPGCEACANRFAKIGEAYEILNNPEKKAAYDQRRAPDGSLDSVASVELTADDFEARVLRSNDVWFVEVYDPTEGMCKSFHPVWEDVAQKNQHVARFGRIDMTKHRRALRFLPQRVVLTPVVFRLARGHAPEMFQPQWNDEGRGSSQLMRWVQDLFPQVPTLETGASLKSFWKASEKPRLLLSGPIASATRGRAREFLQVQRVAHMWDEFVSIGMADSQLVQQTLGNEFVARGKASGKGRPEATWTIAAQIHIGEGDLGETKGATSVETLVQKLQELITRAIIDQAPHITMRNHQQLCGGQGVRTFCLFMVDASEGGSISSSMEELKASRVSFAQEVLELKSADEEATEEQFHIQPVRVMTSSSRMPWLPVAAGSSFRSMWAEVDHASMFVMELETRRVAAVKTPSLRELYQQIAYDDLRFKDLSEHVQLVRGLPDPEVSLQRELAHCLSTAPGALAAFVLVATAIAILPELSLPTIVAISVAILGLALGSWPMATRRLISFFWCTMSPSSFECRVGS
mmetsp:Transcript_48384/g.121953  ORF Transcript_48384/g.121953 Transcript_48384/m.121953 type:complete len:789 (+) Transcript_48384:110-2476(+)